MKKTATKSFETYAAFLRGINVGGNKLVKMADVKKAFESLGLRDVKTLGASGNVIFSAPATDAANVAKRIEDGLRTALGLSSSIMVRSVEQLRQMAASDPFKSVKLTPDIRLYVTFFGAPASSKSGIAIPYQSPDKIFWILKVADSELYSVVDLSTGGSTLDAMGFIEKEFGKNGTTRNWNTFQKLISKA
jgi:uncharacterized protein (DUF1697 family)